MAKKGFTGNCCAFILIALFAECTLAQSSVAEDDKCEMESPCHCRFRDGKYLDMTDLAKTSFLTAKLANLKYFFHGCTNEKLTEKFINLTYNECENTASTLCVLNDENKTILSLGRTNNLTYINVVSEPRTHELIFYVNETLSSIHLVCSPELNSDYLIAETVRDNGKRHKLVLLSPKVCRRYLNHGLSGWITLLIIIVVCSSVYFLGGMIALHYLRGAKGLEMIPNLDFWRSIPNRCRDTFLFLINGCRPNVVHSPDSYDQI